MRTSLADPKGPPEHLSSGIARFATVRWLVISTAACSAVALLVMAVAAGRAAAASLEDAAEQLVAVSEERDRIVALRERAEQRVLESGRVARAVDVEWREFSEVQQIQLRELDAAISEAKATAVQAYIWLGSRGPLAEVWDGGIDNSDGVRRHFAVGRVDVARDAAGRMTALIDDADERQRALAEETARTAAAAADALDDLDLLIAAEREADQRVAEAAEALAAAEEDERDRAAARAAAARAEARAKLPPPSDRGIPSAEQWAKLRHCESTNNYQAVNPSGRYRGAYQFDQRTWESVGGTGDPAAAEPAEQDLRAQILYDTRGRFPWPQCGRFLP